MRQEEIEQRITEAMQLLAVNDEYLFEHNVAERAITHRLGMYLQHEFPSYHVDCEYNRNLGDSKRILLSNIFTQNFEERVPIIQEHLGISLEELQRELRQGNDSRILEAMARINDLKDAIVSTFPDIIIHRRGKNNVDGGDHFNLVVIEAKKQNSVGDWNFDVEKLKAFRNLNQTYKYRYAIFVLFHNDERGTGSNRKDAPRITWQYLDDEGNLGEPFTA